MRCCMTKSELRSWHLESAPKTSHCSGEANIGMGMLLIKSYTQLTQASGSKALALDKGNWRDVRPAHGLDLAGVLTSQ